MQFILASSNGHKAEELNELAKASGISILAAPDKIDVVEDGDTFEENALKKAKAYYDKYQEPTLADDSGLVVPSMPEILGIYSARFAPECSDYEGKNNKLIEVMSGLNAEERRAYFICKICCYIAPNEIFFFEGRVHGAIGHERKGSAGFGYDPVFIPDGQEGKSLAELGEWKMKNSHRSKAMLSLVKFIQGHKSSGQNL